MTDACNLRCKYCGYADLYEGYDKRGSLSFPFQRAKLVIDYLYQNYWTKKVGNGFSRTINIGFYGGEPLLNVPFIQQVIDYVENLPDIGITFSYGMTTNAMLLNRYMDYLVEKDFSVMISLDGDEKGQSYRLDVSGKNSFQRVVQNVRLLKETYPDYFKKRIKFNAVLHDRNSIESIYDFMKSQFDKVPMFSMLNTTDVKKEKKEEFDRMYKNMYTDLKASTKCGVIEKELFTHAPETNMLLNYLRNYSGNMYQNYVSLLLDKNRIELPPTATCTPFLRKLFVTVKGRILQCEKINHDFSLGQVTDNEVLLDLEKIAEQHNKYTSVYLKECKTCAVRTHCKRCIYMFGNPMTDKKCYAYTTENDLRNEQAASLHYLEKHPELYEELLTKVAFRD